jgi:hypothetical protein
MTAIWRRPPADEPVEDATDKPEDAEAGTDGEEVAPDYVIDNIGELRELPIFHP